jgi:hypothetical protein
MAEHCAARKAELSDDHANADFDRVRYAEVQIIGALEMNSTRIAAIALMVAGILGLVYGGFTYTKDTHETKLGPIEIAVKDKETVNVPIWAGIGAIVIGGFLLTVGKKNA